MSSSPVVSMDTCTASIFFFFQRADLCIDVINLFVTTKAFLENASVGSTVDIGLWLEYMTRTCD